MPVLATESSARRRAIACTVEDPGMTIRLDEAIKTAIEFEKKVLKVYQDAEQHAVDPVGRKVFSQLAKEEAGHVAYLESRLTEWQKSGHVALVELRTVLPDKERIIEGRKRLAKPMRGKPVAPTEVEHLKRALAAEKETSAFYRQMVSELAEERRQLFARFLEIEEGHVAIVEAELDAVSGFGFWFGMKEFDLEKG
jgi:rubrerythrin